jgi:two-component system response regulator HydG
MKNKPTILVVDDNQDLLETFAMILKRRGYHVQTAGDGLSAINKFKEQNFDVTLMDIVMPEMSGVDAFKKIKEIQPGAPIILMTAYSDDELIQNAKNEGALKIIHKPIHIDQLIDLINETAGSEPILIVDDDADICDTLTQILELNGYEVLSAASGEEAVMMTKGTSFQIAFIDVKLPKIDGLETLLRLKEINPDIIVIMMTGFRNEVREALEKAQAASAITCLYKPFDPSVVADIVKKINEKKNIKGK